MKSPIHIVPPPGNRNHQSREILFDRRRVVYKFETMFKSSNKTIYILTLIVLTISVYVGNDYVQGEETTSLVQTKPNPVKVVFNEAEGGQYKMQMFDRRTINLTIYFNELSGRNDVFDEVLIRFKVNTLSPQFNILGLYGEQSRAIVLKKINRRQIDSFKFYQRAQMLLVAEYIGHVTIEPSSVEFYSNSKLKSMQELNNIQDDERLHIVIVPGDTILNLIFFISVSIFITITYINIGAQLDIENTQKLIRKPKTLIMGLIITIFVMPIASWFVGQYFLSKQSLYRIGSFVFACGPAASASTLWTVMLDSDKELSVGLQVASTISATFSMPLLLFFMDSAMSMEDGGTKNNVKVPYTRLIQTLTLLSIALWIGYRFVGQSKRAKEISSKIFRPLTFFVLFFIIIFSSIVYYYVYIMFDWTIVLTSLVITMITYIVSGLLGYIINTNLDHSIAISISSTYKNSGIAFGVLVVAFESPDTYIAYVPCLTQVVTTSLTLYLFYCILKLINFIRRRNQPAAINAEMPSSNEQATTDGDTMRGRGGVGGIIRKETRSDSIGDKSTRSDGVNSNELMTINVHDVVPGSPISRKESSSVETTASSSSNKAVIGGAANEEVGEVKID